VKDRLQKVKTDKLAEALAEGRLWRAKEILTGRIGSGLYEPDVCEQLGLLLLRMGDDLQAGKFLFLSGERRPEYDAPIELFVRRYARASRHSFVATFPAAVRRTLWSQLPPRVQRDLVAAGVEPRAADEPLWIRRANYPDGQLGWKGCLLGLLVIVGIGLLLSVVVVYFNWA